MSDKDIFYLEKVFPEPSQIFQSNYKTATAIAEDCVFVLDTNVLLVPFHTSEKNLEDIRKILTQLKEENRLFLPARAVREFANNRAGKLGELFLKLRQSKANLNSGHFQLGDYPLLSNNVSFQNLQKNFEQIRALLKEAQKMFASLERDILAWNWDDSVSALYKDIFTGDLIKEVQKSERALEDDLAFRIKYKVAPGYKDSNKPDDGIGDLMIWQTAMEIAKDQKKDLIIVSNDQKNDWFYKQDKEGLYPRYELFDEFRRFTGGGSMQIVNFTRFLELLHASTDTIQEVKESLEKAEIRVYRRGFTASQLALGLRIEHEHFGRGVIKHLIGNSDGNDKAEVIFDGPGYKQLYLPWAPLRILQNSHNFRIINPVDLDSQTFSLFEFREEDEE